MTERILIHNRDVEMPSAKGSIGCFLRDGGSAQITGYYHTLFLLLMVNFISKDFFLQTYNMKYLLQKF